MLTKIEKGSIVLTYVALPCFYGKAVEVLTDVTVLKRFAANGVEIELSEHLLQCGKQEVETLKSMHYPISKPFSKKGKIIILFIIIPIHLIIFCIDGEVADIL